MLWFCFIFSLFSHEPFGLWHYDQYEIQLDQANKLSMSNMRIRLTKKECRCHFLLQILVNGCWTSLSTIKISYTRFNLLFNNI